jgi:hypothetical protein
VSPHHSPVPAIEVSDDPGEGGGDAVGQQARNCPVRAFSSGAVEEQSAEWALYRRAARPWTRCIAFRRKGRRLHATRTPSGTRLRVSRASQRAVRACRTCKRSSVTQLTFASTLNSDTVEAAWTWRG